jgi:hypothetical protein
VGLGGNVAIGHRREHLQAADAHFAANIAKLITPASASAATRAAARLQQRVDIGVGAEHGARAAPWPAQDRLRQSDRATLIAPKQQAATDAI